MSWPTTPTIGDKYTLDGKTWVYVGNDTWERKDITLEEQDIKTLNTDNATAQAVSASEAIAGSGSIALHKVSKTGSYDDLLSKPTLNIADWDEAHGWGDHALVGYLTEETDPTVPSHVKEITTTNISNWGTAYNMRHSRQHNITNSSDHQMSGERIVGRTISGTGAPQELTATSVRTFLNVADGANNYTLPAASGATRGGIKVGGGLNISGDVLSVDFPDPIWEAKTDQWAGDYIHYDGRYVVIGEDPPFIPDWVWGIYMRTSGSTGGTTAMLIENSNGDTLMSLTNNGTFIFPSLSERTLFDKVMVVDENSGEIGWQDMPSGGGASTLANLTDTTISGPSNGQVLTYDGGIWKNMASGSGVTTFAALNDTPAFATGTTSTTASKFLMPNSSNNALVWVAERTAFNRNFGSVSGTVCQGNDSRLSNARDWTASIVSQAEAEAGTATTARKWTAQRVAQAINALAPSGEGGGEGDNNYVTGMSWSYPNLTLSREGLSSLTGSLAHGHGNITTDGKIGSAANKVIITGSGGALTETSVLEVQSDRVRATENIHVAQGKQFVIGDGGVGSWRIYAPGFPPDVLRIQYFASGINDWVTMLEVNAGTNTIDAADFKLKE